LEPARTIIKIEKRREFVRALCNEQCPKNSFKRLYIFKGLLDLVEKVSFSKEFQWELQCGGEVPRNEITAGTHTGGVDFGFQVVVLFKVVLI